MNRWDRFDRYAPPVKKPPPEHGIRMKKAGTTWWGQHWIQALELVLRAQAGRLARGRTYARAGRTHDLVVECGKVKAQVTGSRATPYAVTIELEQLDEATWKKAIDGMAAKAQFSAELLAGHMPIEVDHVFQAAGTSLFPKQRSELKTSCSCPDWGDPCKHVAATHYVLGEAFDRDPFLLFELRGKTKDQVLEALRAARVAKGEPEAKRRKQKAKPTIADEVPAVKLGKLKATDYDRPRAPLPSLQFAFDEPAASGAVLRQLGAPAGWGSEGSPADALAPLVRAAAETARRIATLDTEPAPSVPSEPKDELASAPEPRGRARVRKKSAKRGSRQRE